MRIVQREIEAQRSVFVSVPNRIDSSQDHCPIEIIVIWLISWLVDPANVERVIGVAARLTTPDSLGNESSRWQRGPLWSILHVTVSPKAVLSRNYIVLATPP